MQAAHGLAVILGDHRRVALALAIALAFAVIAAVDLYVQARTGHSLATFYRGAKPAHIVAAAPKTFYRG